MALDATCNGAFACILSFIPYSGFANKYKPTERLEFANHYEASVDEKVALHALNASLSQLSDASIAACSPSVAAPLFNAAARTTSVSEADTVTAFPSR